MRRLLAAIVLGWFSFNTPAQAQETEIPSVPFEGPEIFCHVLASLDMKPITSFKQALNDPTYTVVIVFGKPDVLQGKDVKGFLTKGGSLLIATDYEWDNPGVPVQITGSKVVEPDNKHHFRGSERCPLLFIDHGKTPRNPSSADHPCFRFLHHDHGIATNSPSEVVIKKDAAAIVPLLDFSETAMPERNALAEGMKLPLRVSYMAGSAKNAPPHSRELYIAGHGLFMNGMMAQTATANFEFAGNTVRWLREGSNGKLRTKVLFIVDGAFLTKFDMKLTKPPPLPVPRVEILNRLLRDCEMERFCQTKLAEAIGANMNQFIAALFGLVTLCVLLYAAKKLLSGRSAVETNVPIVPGLQSAVRDTAPADQRRQALLRKENLWEEAHYLAAEWFRQEFGMAPNEQTTLQAAGSLWSRWRLQRQADAMLRLARSARPSAVSKRQFFALIETLRNLNVSRKDRRLALLVEGKIVRQT